MSGDKSGTPPCGLYARIDDFSDMIKTITAFRQMAMVINQASGYKRNMHVAELVHTEGNVEKIADLLSVVKAQGLVCVISGVSLEQAQGAFAEADGFLLTSLEDLIKFRAALGDDPILGVMAEGSVDARADYAVLPADPAMIAKASRGGEVIVCARGEGITNDNVGVLVQAGASFIDCGDYIFSHEKGVMQGAVNMLYALELAGESTDADMIN